jgi:hypothetical protein
LFSPGTPVFSSNKTNHHDITEILLKVVLNAIKQTNPPPKKKPKQKQKRAIKFLHQFWLKKICPSKFNLEYGGTFTKLFMHVSSRNMFPTARNLQIRVHVYRPRHYCGD